MSTLDWADFFESVSLVDDTLRGGSSFGAMDFATRDQYRHAIEDLARASARSELEVTRLAMAAAKRAVSAAQRSGASPGGRAEDPGYYLISDGRRVLEKEISYHVPVRLWLLRAFLTSATPRYLATIVAVTGALLALPLLIGHASGMALGGLILLALLAVIPASDLAVALVNRAVMACSARCRCRVSSCATAFPGLRTLVVVPTLLTSEADIEEHVGRLEIHFLANPDGDLHFALLSDWVDAPTETMPEDDRLLAAAADGIARLNARHGPAPPAGARFLLLHRRRLWNAARGQVDGLGAQAREARRAQPPAPRRERHDVHSRSAGGRPACPRESAT